MKSVKLFIVLQLVVFFLNQNINWGQNKFHLSTGKEAAILGGSSALLLSSLAIEKKVSITPQEIYSLNLDDINTFDRSAINYYSKKISLVSDVLMFGSVSLPFSFIFMDDAKDELKNIGIMYFETLTFTYGITNLTKNIFQRFRPYAYNQSVDLSEKLDPDTKKSFFSGHTSISFASAVFFSTVFSELSSNDQMKKFVWVGSLSLATTTGLLRYFSGKHFPTDVLVGAIAGGLVGYLIPQIHKSKDNLSINISGKQDLISISVAFDSNFMR